MKLAAGIPTILLLILLKGALLQGSFFLGLLKLHFTHESKSHYGCNPCHH